MSDDPAKPDKPKFPRGLVNDVLAQLHAELRAACEEGFCEAAGSWRRRKPACGDLEIVYVPRFGLANTGGLFDEPANLADLAIEKLERAGVLARRKNVNGSEMFGDKNKLMVHVATGLPVDLFATTKEAFPNYLVCRTGGAENNVQIASAAKRKGWQWNPYGSGFSRRGPLAGEKEFHVVTSERAVFDFVGLPYREPWERT